MIPISIQIDDVLQGHFRFEPLNLLFFFQPGCSGCFTYGIPETLKLQEEHKDWLQVFGVSTMFENPELNHAANTRALLWSGELVGEAKEVFADLGFEKYPHEITFPILADKICKPAEHLEGELERLCAMHPDFENWPEAEKKNLEAKIREYVAAYPKAGYSFVFNMLRGTPSWVLITEDMQLLGTWFGHDALPDLKETLLEIKEDLKK
jgi:hypothetical protein